MENLSQRETDVRPLSSIVREVSTSLGNMLKCEISLAKAEFKDAADYLVAPLLQLLLFAGMIMLGALSFVSFCIIGLGVLLDNNYWLSSLLIAAVLLTVGVGLAFRTYGRMRTADLSFPRTRQTVNREISTMQQKVHEISNAAKRRAS